MTHITCSRIRSHRPLALPRRKIPPTTAQTGGRRRSYNFTLSGPGGNPRSRLEDWNPNFGLQPCTVRMRILTTLLYPKSPPADGFVTRPGPPRPGRGGSQHTGSQEVALAMADYFQDNRSRPCTTRVTIRPKYFDVAVFVALRGPR